MSKSNNKSIKNDKNVKYFDTNLNFPKIRKLEKQVMLYIAKHNNGHIIPFPSHLIKKYSYSKDLVKDSDIIHSLHRGGFLEQKKGIHVLRLTKNVMYLIQIEGESAFNDILVQNKEEE